MIVILGYNSSESVFLNEIFENNNIKYCYSLLEHKILSADKIILPSAQNINSTYRKLNMMNLFSMMRMIKKPMFGINNGVQLMCNRFSEKLKCGLGFFETDFALENNQDNDSLSGKINILKKSKLLKNNFQDIDVIFNPKLQPSVCIDTKAEIICNNKNYSFLYEANNHYGIILNQEKNKKLFTDIIKNFIEI